MAARVLLVGCGKMGGALARGWVAHGIEGASITVVEPDAAARESAARDYGVRALARPDELEAAYRPGAVVFAVKPQVVDEVLPRYRRFAEAGAVSLSIAAGRSVASLEACLGARAAIVRAMPNTPAAVGRGITAAVANASATSAQRELCDELLRAVGEVVWLEDESLLDAVTAVSGSGPAYVFLLAECLAEAGVEAGLAPELAARLARATVVGSAELLRQSGEEPAALRRAVASPGGTTEAALEILMGPEGLRALMTRAVAAAAARSRELAG